jgi:plasmid stabilization system protein ParE
VKLVILPLAVGELNDAAALYVASANVELDSAFVAEFDRAASEILANPQIGPVFRGTRRGHLLRRFPYSIIHQVASDDIRIVAVAHQRCRPAYWAGRKWRSAAHSERSSTDLEMRDHSRSNSSFRISTSRFPCAAVKAPGSVFESANPR